ncbi:GNAT family N-acetyltransferase [Leuconostoc falkenbergense]|uniref:GNAT family N-acetyltransferase n=1 Tax=Leuconostoc falkenbergense TaxID=2766470 RepID=UPI001665E53E|nr:GNAT family protein [Leuconostoc falkenbergense]
MFIGKNVKLSHYHETDGENLANWQWDENFLSTLTSDMIHPYTANDWEKIFLENTDSSENVAFTIRKTNDDSLVGYVTLTDISVRNHSCELGIGFPKAEDRSIGYGTEAMKLILDYGFNNLNMHKIKLSVYPFNTGAVKAYTKVGFVKEGTAKDEIFYDGKWVDIDYYAIFQDDWFAKQR